MKLLLMLGLASVAYSQVTYTREISRLFREKCEVCHRQGDIAPFALDSYEAAKTWGDDIQRVVRERIMPPWKPVEGHGSFKNNFGLSAEQRQTILDWYLFGAPEGDASELPEPLAQIGEWRNGEPDLTIQMPEMFEIPRRKDIYRCFVVPSGLDEDKWLKAVQIVPGNRQVVHHVILYLDRTGRGEELDARDEGPGYDCFGGPGPGVPLGPGSIASAWVPGNQTAALPEGVGTLLPRDAKIIVQIHYFPGGKDHSDQTKIGLYFAKPEEEITKRMVFFPLANATFRIPPGADAHEASSTVTLLPGLTGHAHVIVPHMHLLGKEIEVTKTNAITRASESLIRIEDWDFNWQGFFFYREPVRLGAWDQIRLRCRFDNSASNPRNPSNPLREVRWGEGTEDEMCIAVLGVTLDNPGLLEALPFRRTR